MNGLLITKRLRELGWSDEMFAAKLKCSMSTVKNMKNGRGVRVERAVQVASVLGIELSQLFAQKDQMAVSSA